MRLSIRVVTLVRRRADGFILVAAISCAVAAQVLFRISPFSGNTEELTVEVSSARLLLTVIVGLVIRRQRPRNAVGPILIAAGFAGWINTIEFIDHPLPWTLSNAFRLAILPISAHLYVAYPGTRPIRGVDRRLVALTYGFWLAQSFLRLAVFDSASPAVCTRCPANLLLLIPDQGALWLIGIVGTLGSAVLAFGVAWRVHVHWATGTEAVRRALVPAVLAAPIVIFDALLYVIWLQFGGHLPFLEIFNGPAYQVVAISEPLVLLAGVLRTQFDRSAVSGLMVAIGGAASLDQMQAALRSTLHDGSIQLFTWSRGAGGWVDAHGAAHELPTPTDAVAVTHVERHGTPLAALVHDAAVGDEPVLLSAATAALRLALDNERLTASVSAQTEQADRLPRGRVTLLYTDIEGSTEHLARLGEGYLGLLFEARGLIRRIVRARRGREVDARADEFLAVFPDAADAADAALAIVRRTRTQAWPEGAEVRVRVGLHTGEPELTPEGYVGLDVHRVARIGNAGHGGQIVMSAATAVAIATAVPDDAHVTRLGSAQLRGLPDRDELYQLDAPDLRQSFPPLRDVAITD